MLRERVLLYRDLIPVKAVDFLKIVLNYLRSKVLDVVYRGRLQLKEFFPIKGTFYNRRDGFYFFVTTTDELGFMVLHEAWQKPYLANALGEGSVFLDVGACYGRFTMMGARLVGESGRVVALEPDPRAFRHLVANMRLNNLKNVVALPAAALNQDGTERLHLSNMQGLSSFTDLQWDKNVAARSKTIADVDVQAITLDNLVYSMGLNRVDLIKVDVEGVEDKVLEGAIKTLEAHHPSLLLEVHSESVWNRCREILESRGYWYTVIHSYTRNFFHAYAAKK